MATAAMSSKWLLSCECADLYTPSGTVAGLCEKVYKGRLPACEKMCNHKVRLVHGCNDVATGLPTGYSGLRYISIWRVPRVSPFAPQRDALARRADRLR